MNLIKKQDFFLLEEVIRKNFSSKYKDSILGIFWSVLNPLLSVIVLTIVFSTLLGRGIENYPVYLLSGRCVFGYFAGTVPEAPFFGSHYTSSFRIPVSESRDQLSDRD